MTFVELEAKLQLRCLLPSNLSDREVFQNAKDIAQEARFPLCFEDLTTIKALYLELMNLNCFSKVRAYIYAFYKNRFGSEVCNHFSFGYIPSEWYEGDRINAILSLSDDDLWTLFNKRHSALRMDIFPSGKYSYCCFVVDRKWSSSRIQTTAIAEIRKDLISFFGLQHKKQSREEWITQKLKQLKIHA